MNDFGKLTTAFTESATALVERLSDHMQADDPQAYAKLNDAIGQGHQVSLSMVTSVHGAPRIELALIADQDTRLTVMTLNAQQIQRH